MYKNILKCVIFLQCSIKLKKEKKEKTVHFIGRKTNKVKYHFFRRNAFLYMGNESRQQKISIKTGTE